MDSGRGGGLPCAVRAPGPKAAPRAGSPTWSGRPVPGWPWRCLPGRASALRSPARRCCSAQPSGSFAGPGGGLHNARHCPSLASCRRNRRPRPRLAGDPVPAPDWLLAPTEVRAVSHTRAHVDLGAGAGLKGPRHHHAASGRRTVAQWIMGGRGGAISCHSSEKMSGPRLVLKRGLLPGPSGPTEQDTLALPEVGKRNADPWGVGQAG